LKKLQQDVDRGELDRDLLRKLGWTPQHMEAFITRMQRQLAEQQGAEPTSSDEALRRQRFEELLRSLDLSAPNDLRQGSAEGNQQLQDRTIDRPQPSGRVGDRWRKFRESISKDAAVP